MRISVDWHMSVTKNETINGR